jgi:hypothetical protein
MLFICLLFSLLLLSLTTAQSNSSSLVSDADRLQAAKNRAALTKLPRYQLSGFQLQQAPKRFCGAADNNGRDCNWTVYAESVLLIGALALVAAGLALLFCPIFWALRCCGCCGGLKKTHGWICPGEERTIDDPYTPRSVWVVRCGVIMCAGILFIAFIIAQVGNTGLSNGIELYADTSVQRARDLALDINTTVLKVEALAAKAALVPNLNFNVSALVQPLKAGVKDIAVIADEFESVAVTVKEYDTKRSTIQWAAGIVSLILVFIAVIGAICSLPLFAKVLGVLGFFAFAFAWVSFALNYSVAVVIADFCTEVEVVLSTGDTTNVAVQLYANCSALVGVAGIKNQIDLQLNRSLTQVCSSIGSVCNMTQPCLDDYSRTCPVVACAVPPNQCNRMTLPRFVNSTVNDALFGCVPPSYYNQTTMMMTTATTTTPMSTTGAMCPRDSSTCDDDGLLPGPCQGPFNRTLTECSTACLQTQLRTASLQVVFATQFMTEVDDVLVNHVNPLLGCERVKVVFQDTKDFICVSGLSSFYSLAGGMGVTGVFYVFAIIFGVLGSKRFTRDFRERFDELKTATITRFQTLRGGGARNKNEMRSRRKSYAPELRSV